MAAPFLPRIAGADRFGARNGGLLVVADRDGWEWNLLRPVNGPLACNACGVKGEHHLSISVTRSLPDPTCSDCGGAGEMIDDAPDCRGRSQVRVLCDCVRRNEWEDEFIRCRDCWDAAAMLVVAHAMRPPFIVIEAPTKARR
jgi:hypothetical protein